MPLWQRQQTAKDAPAARAAFANLTGNKQPLALWGRVLVDVRRLCAPDGLHSGLACGVVVRLLLPDTN